jgi:hypothetical protein
MRPTKGNSRCGLIPTVVVPESHRARRVKVEASCCANLDAPARDAGWTRQRRPLRASGETECRHVQAQVAASVPRRGVERPAGRSPAPVHRLSEASGTRPQAALRGMAAMVCGLRYDDDNRLVPLEGAAA